MFEMMLPLFAGGGIEQFLLEVITTNDAARALYEGLGFRAVREVALLQRDQRMSTFGLRRAAHIDLKTIENPDWGHLTKFWDGKPSWQNTIDAVNRSRANKRIIGAFIGDYCVGYIIFSSIFGRVAHLAVHKEHRQQGIGTSLVVAMQAEMAEGYSMQVINIDKTLTGSMEFFRHLGFDEKISQYEMIKAI
jgi:ribosomal protein S18 acetylase RimI-like enzyme